MYEKQEKFTAFGEVQVFILVTYGTYIPSLSRNRFLIGIVFKNVSPLDTPAYDMMQGTRGIYSGLAWHVTSFPQINEKRNAQIQPRPPLWISETICYYDDQIYMGIKPY